MRLLLVLLCVVFTQCCIHDQFIKTVQKRFLDDMPQVSRRLLQAQPSQIGNIRIHTDYSFITASDVPTTNMIKRLVNISTLVFYNMITVERLQKLYYPSAVSTNCATLTVPDQYVKNGISNADLGILVGDQKGTDTVNYIAKASSCAYLASSKRPIWGVIIWNAKNLKYDQEGFQQTVFVALHEITHVLGFSALAYEMYPSGSPIYNGPDGTYINTSKVRQEVSTHFGCPNNQGLMLENEDGTLLSSHWQRKFAFNEYMTASNSKNTIISRFTLALLDSIGWYHSINYEYAQSNLWGKNRGCDFLKNDTCVSQNEFCSQGFGCDFDATGIGSCRADAFTNSCPIQKHYTNTICLDPAYNVKNLNAKMNALEAGGWSSRCFNSDFRQRGLNKTSLNYRCYTATCAKDKKSIYINVGQNVLICKTPGQVIKAPLSLTGTLTCPNNFEYYCQTKQTCPNNCNINGMCINGKCLCTGSNKLSDGCLQVELTVQQVGAVGGLPYSLRVGSNLSLNQTMVGAFCFQGYVLNEFGDCSSCAATFNCSNCTAQGCTRCDNGYAPLNGRC